MKLYSTRQKAPEASLQQALFAGMPADQGLYMPVAIPRLPVETLNLMEGLAFPEIAFLIAQALIGDSVEDQVLKEITREAFSFPVPLRQIGENEYVLELFHGPSLAFKDFGARFMSRLMGSFPSLDKRELQILVATSGDTGGAVAMGFYGVPGIRVTILYPSGRVSNLQEKQMTTLGGNIRALEVAGSFDDCQGMVKQAFADRSLNQELRLSSANSINIGRLIPQIFYYFYGWACLPARKSALYYSVPSGNFGNLVAGLMAWKMGLPITRLAASTNANDVVPQWLISGEYRPRPSVHTLSTAMDVGNPSNFERIVSLFQGDRELVKSMVSGYSFSDEETRQAIRRVYDRTGYILCPHSAVAWLGLQALTAEKRGGQYAAVLLATAHPGKFPDIYDADMASQIHLPELDFNMQGAQQISVKIAAEYSGLRRILLESSR